MSNNLMIGFDFDVSIFTYLLSCVAFIKCKTDITCSAPEWVVILQTLLIFPASTFVVN